MDRDWDLSLRKTERYLWALSVIQHLKECWCNNLPPYVLEFVDINSMGLMWFTSAHRVTGPWNQEKFDSNTKDNPRRGSEGYHQRL